MLCDICCELHVIFEGPCIFDAKDYQKYTTQCFLSQLLRIDVRATVTHAEHTDDAARSMFLTNFVVGFFVCAVQTHC